MAQFRQLWLLLWKNYVLQIRRPIGTAVELLIPVFAMIVLVLIRLVLDNSSDSGEQCFTTFDEQSVTAVYGDQKELKPPFVIAYAPNGDANVTWIMENANAILIPISDYNIITLKDYETENLAVEAAEQDELQEEFHFIGVAIFESLGDEVQYKLRLPHTRSLRDTWHTDSVFPVFKEPGPREEGGYFRGFIQLQYAVERAIIAWKVKDMGGSSSPKPIPVTMRQFPFPSYINDTFSNVAQLILPLLIVFAFIYTAGQVVKELVYEKQERLKETMKMMGLANWIHWVAWFMKELSFMLIPVILMTIIASAGEVFRRSDGLIIFIFLFVFVISGISFLFMLSTFFSSARLGMICGYLFWFLTFFPYLIVSGDNVYPGMNRHTKSVACLVSTMCMGFGSRQILVWESRNVGVKWSNIGDGPTVEDDFSVGIAIGMMMLDTVIYLIIAWYTEAVFPGEYGIPQPWYFPVMTSYWIGKPPTNAVDSEENVKLNELESSPTREADPTNLPVGISIRNLTKVYRSHVGGSNKLAVDGLSLNMYNGQITSLLGHNGAGKTTTMSVITGLFPPTSGDVYVNGHSVVTDIKRVRQSLGLCPQHNVLFDRLTVKEHLDFFIQLKGISKGPEMDKEVREMIEDLELVDKTNCQASALSGGMKRKLSVAVALIGGSQVVVLDEPTAGMDPSARRATWDLLLKHKHGRTVLLTTHYMDEADLLGDRVAIMAEGQIRCVGSSHFLKERYGVGYHLTIVKNENCNPVHVTQYIKQQIPSAKLHSDVGHELSYILPGDQTSRFGDFFKQFEEESGALGVESFGMSLTTMEEVFLRVEEGVEESKAERHQRQQSILVARQSSLSMSVRGKPSTSSNNEDQKRNLGFDLWVQQFVAMYIKRFTNSKRDLYAVIWQLLLPILFTALALLNVRLIEFGGDDPPRVMTLKDLGSTTAYIADFPQIADVAALEHANEHLKDVGVTQTLNVTMDCIDIQQKAADNATDCCQNKFLVLQDNCIDSMTREPQVSVDSCGDPFGYRLCDGCGSNCLNWSNVLFTLLNNPSDDCPLLPSRIYKRFEQTYFMQYILQQSNDETFFDDHASGFTLIRHHNDSDFTSYYKTKRVELGDATVVATVWYSNQAFHTSAAALNAYSNIVLQFTLRQSLGATKSEKVHQQKIRVTNHPLPKTTDSKTEDALTDPSGLVLSFFVSLGLGFLACSFILFPIQERESNAKHLQFLSGVTPTSYWFGTFCWDFTNYLVPALVIVILFAAYQIDAYTNDLGAVFLVLILYGCAVLPFVYLISFLVKSPYVGFAAAVLVIVMTSWFGFILVYVFALPGVGQRGVADKLTYIFYLQPNFAISQSFADMYTNGLLKESCSIDKETETQCHNKGLEYFDNVLHFGRPGIGIGCLYMGLEAIFFSLLIILAEHRFFTDEIIAHFRDDQVVYQSMTNEDSDVAEERRRVLATDFSVKGSIVAVMGLTKKYHGAPGNAVDHLSFTIPHGECFGLLGLNGAGKTTIFRMLTGDLSMTTGNAYVDELSIRENLHDVQRRIGYCPQFDALIERLTGRELLTMYSRLRGYKERSIKQLVESTIERLDLGQYADKPCGTYSGGNKRKLSTAIALVGDPVIIFLDEPTAGMDPKARRFLWDCLVGILREGRSIVLTSHSMEECEALCTRLAIMVNGQFKCLGSIQHLKNKFGRGYSLTVVVGDEPDNASPQTAPVEAFITQTFPGAHLIEHHRGQLEYEISDENTTWSTIFGEMEIAQTRLHLASYAVSQTTLEQVFLHFAKEQRDQQAADLVVVTGPTKAD